MQKSQSGARALLVPAPVDLTIFAALVLIIAIALI